MIPRYILSVFAFLLFLPSILSAQTVATLPLAKSAFCIGEPVTVNYTVTGALNAGNAIVLQLSGPDGSFTQGFRNLTSVSSTVSGSIQTTIPSDLPGSAKYRFRVTASNPRVDGSDNGTDIAVYRPPSVSIGFGSDVIWMSGVAVLFQDVPATLVNTTKGAKKFWWNLGIGVGASPEQTGETAPTVTYSTPGEKTITFLAYNFNDCEYSGKLKVRVLPTVPVIPANVLIVRGDTTLQDYGNSPSAIWVCPGGICRTNYPSGVVFYIESGGTVTARHFGENIIYAKSGAYYSAVSKLAEGPGIIYYEDGASVPTFDSERDVRFIKQPALTFDYSNVPANGCPSLAPYTVQIKQNANSIHTAQNEEKSDAEYWVHNDGNLRSGGNGNTYCVEPGGEVTINGSGNKIYVKDGSKVNVQSGEGNRIFYEAQATIVNGGVDAILLPSSGITFVSAVSSGVTEDAVRGGEELLTISPNPVGEVAELRVDESMGGVHRVHIYNTVGEEVGQFAAEGSLLHLSMQGYAAGTYYVKVETEKGELRGTIVKR